MHISEIEKYRNRKEAHMRHGHMDKQDREVMAEYSHPYPGDKNYHSPDREGIDYNSHGVEMQ